MNLMEKANFLVMLFEKLNNPISSKRLRVLLKTEQKITKALTLPKSYKPLSQEEIGALIYMFYEEHFDACDQIEEKLYTEKCNEIMMETKIPKNASIH